MKKAQGVAKLFPISYIPDMEYEIQLTDECSEWILELSDSAKADVLASIGLLETVGPNLGYPHSSKITVRSTLTCENCGFNIAVKPIESYMPMTLSVEQFC